MPTLEPEKILHELQDLWLKLAQGDQGTATAAGVLRACAMTLIVAAEDAADAQAVGETVAALMHEHPSRAIVLKPSTSGELDARVFAQCWMPFGGRQQICCEQIEIAAAPERLGDVPGLMLGLLAPDLPVVLWCRGERWLSEPQFAQLLPLVNKLIVDSNRFTSVTAAFDRIAELQSGKHRVADLAWARLTGWREVIAQSFDTPAELEAIGDIREIRIGYSGQKPTSSVYYLAAWLKRALPAAEVVLQPGEGDHDRIRFVKVGPLSFRPAAGRCTVELESEKSHNLVVLETADDYHAMREELTISRRDVIFEEVFAIAHTLKQQLH